MEKSTVVLDLKDAIQECLIDKDIVDGLSAATSTGKYLWLVGDENISLQRLEKQEDGSYGKAVTFFLLDFIELPDKDEEADVEGIDFDGKYLWIVGSHSYKRKNISADTEDIDKEIKRLTKVKIDPNRSLLARIPCVPNEQGEYVLHRSCPDPKDPKKTLHAAKLKHGKKSSQLTKALKKDDHLKDYLKIPGKDNGFDIEGLAAFEEKVFVGLRGPVLRGWAIILEVQLKEVEDHVLELEQIGRNGEYYRKFFVDLNGMGVRELATDGEDLLILAGPTMDLDGSMAVYRWRCGTQPQGDRLIAQKEIKEIIELPYRSTKHGINKAEGMAQLDDNSILLVYDSPGKERRVGDYAVKADLFQPKE